MRIFWHLRQLYLVSVDVEITPQFYWGKITDAVKIMMDKYQSMTIVECLDFPDFFAFALAEKGFEKESFGGGYYTVNKTSGIVGTFNPIDDLNLFSMAEPIKLS